MAITEVESCFELVSTGPLEPHLTKASNSEEVATQRHAAGHSLRLE